MSGTRVGLFRTRCTACTFVPSPRHRGSDADARSFITLATVE